MTEATGHRRRRPPRGLIVGMVALGVVVGWFMLRLYASPVARECATGYPAARTAADSTRVDSLVPDHKEFGRSCGSLRAGARWQ